MRALSAKRLRDPQQHGRHDLGVERRCGIPQTLLGVGNDVRGRGQNLCARRRQRGRLNPAVFGVGRSRDKARSFQSGKDRLHRLWGDEGAAGKGGVRGAGLLIEEGENRILGHRQADLTQFGVKARSKRLLRLLQGEADRGVRVAHHCGTIVCAFATPT